MKASFHAVPAVALIAGAIVAGASIPLIREFAAPDAGEAPGPRPAPFLDRPARVRDASGEAVDLRAADGGASVVVFVGPRDEGAIREAEAVRAAFPDRRLRVAVIGDGPGQAPRDPPILRDDRDGSLARRFGVTVVPEAFVIDGDGLLKYRGRVADGDLREAVAAVLDGKAPPLASRPPVGEPLSPRTAANPTYHADVAPILEQSCRPCHRPGQSGPFPLLTYGQAAKRARDLAVVAEQRTMPPWKPDPAQGPPLLHDRTLLDAEVATLRAWADAGAPEGDPPIPSLSRHDPEPDAWALGTPDLVLEMPEDFAIPASGGDVYRCFVLPTGLAESRAITAIEVRPGNPRVVHHTFAYVDVRGLGRERDEADAGPGYMCFSGFTGDRIFGALGGWTPGNEPHFYGEGVGQVLPPNSDVVVQVHYHPSGKPETDRTRLGLHFAKEPIRQALQWVSACADPDTFALPAGDPEIDVVAELTLPMDVDLHAMTPHMHLLGRSMTATITLPDGRERPLIAIPDWDFNRQDTYFPREPLRLPEGTTIRVVGRFDNSARNPRNPSNPPKGVRWGEATTDDMMILFVALTQAGQDLTRPGATDDFMEDFFRRAEAREAAAQTKAPRKAFGNR